MTRPAPAGVPDAMRPHRVDVDPHSNQQNCRCGYHASWRYHQPWWWRWANPGKRWRR